jgi:phosphatidate cytidylyltransferase
LKQRIMTGLLAGAGFISLMYIGNHWFAALILALALIAFLEYLRMFQYKAFDLTSLVGYAGIAYLVTPWNLIGYGHSYSFQTAVWLLLFILFTVTVITKNRTAIDKAAIVFIGVVYIGFGSHYMIQTRLLDNGLFWTLLLFSCIWLTDTGAYFTGRAIGKHLLWPAISPKKTVEGALGGIAFSVAAAIVFSLYRPDLLEITTAVRIGIIVAFIGQLGDLMQSAYKRVRGVKDTGAILPGHGGVLDRVDSWLVVFPFVHLLNVLSY